MDERLTTQELEEFNEWLDWQQSKYEGALAELIDDEQEKENLAEASTFDEIPF